MSSKNLHRLRSVFFFSLCVHPNLFVIWWKQWQNGYTYYHKIIDNLYAIECHGIFTREKKNPMCTPRCQMILHSWKIVRIFFHSRIRAISWFQNGWVIYMKYSRNTFLASSSYKYITLINIASIGLIRHGLRLSVSVFRVFLNAKMIFHRSNDDYKKSYLLCHFI